jgi:rhamnosyltransferase
MMSLPVKENLCAIVTSFNPDGNFKERIVKISGQVAAVVVVDNNSNRGVSELLAEMSGENNLQVIFNQANLGVATALNLGITMAKDLNYQWVMLFDQDTIVSDQMVDLLCKSYADTPERDSIAIIGPGYDAGKIPPDAYTNKLKEVEFLITSGSLIAVDTIDKTGPMLDSLFIDYVDIEYCLRARKMGFRIMQLDTPLMKHSIGAMSLHRLPGKEVGTTNHSALRRYYMMRNHVLVIKKYFTTFPVWAVKSLFARGIETMKILLFENEKLLKIKYSAIGFIDGISGKTDRELSSNTKKIESVKV